MDAPTNADVRVDADHVVTSMHRLVEQLIQALGLPKHLVAFTLHCRAGEIMTVDCEYYPTVGQIDVPAIETATKQYVIVPVDAVVGELPKKG